MHRHGFWQWVGSDPGNFDDFEGGPEIKWRSVKMRKTSLLAALAAAGVFALLAAVALQERTGRSPAALLAAGGKQALYGYYPYPAAYPYAGLVTTICLLARVLALVRLRVCWDDWVHVMYRPRALSVAARIRRRLHGQRRPCS